MRLLILYDVLSPEPYGGVERRNDQLARVLVEHGHSVTLSGLGEGPTNAPYDAISLGPLLPLYDKRGRRTATRALRYTRRIRRLDLTQFDAVETASLPYVHLFPLARTCARHGVSLAVTWYEFWGDYWRGYVGAARAPAFRIIERLAARRGNRIAASCRLTGDRLARLRPDVRVIPCGLDVDEVVAAARKKPDRPAAPIVFAGRLQDSKRIDLLLHAVSCMSRPGLLVSVFGDGPDRARLERLANEMDLGERVEFWGRVPTSQELWSVLATAELAVQPSEREGFGLFPLEAMALGLPVVYCESPESAVGELVRDGREGMACASEPAALAQALDDLLESPERRRGLSEAARRRADEYRWDRLLPRYLEWLGFPDAR